MNSFQTNLVDTLSDVINRKLALRTKREAVEKFIAKNISDPLQFVEKYGKKDPLFAAANDYRKNLLGW